MPVMGLNSSHLRTLAAGLAHIDELFSQIEAAANSAAANSPFPRFQNDLTPTQRQVIADHVARFRAQVAEAVSAMRISDPGHSVRASWAIQTALTLISIDLAEIAPDRLRGYGEVAPEGIQFVERLLADLERTLTRLRAYLNQGLGKDLAGRLARLERAPVDLDLLRVLERVVTERGFIEFRGVIDSLLEQLETGTFEIAMFGRVSAGKSSLLDTVLETRILPVGVTPVTAVATRIQWGDSPSARVSFAEGPEEEVAAERLSEYVTEADNPGNAKRVTRVVVCIPSPRLRAGIVFVDTPGVGRLATVGGRESYAYLPRCDLGIVLVDAGGSPAPEDLELLRLLYDSGIPGMALMSKADLLSAEDRVRMRDYLEREIKGSLGLDLPVHPVSSREPDADLARRWFAIEIEPLCGEVQAARDRSSRRKLGHLREGVAAALRTALGRPEEAAGTERGRGEIERLAAEAEASLRRSADRCERIARGTNDLASQVIDIVARVLAAGEGADTSAVAAIVEEALVAAGDRAVSEVQKEFVETRTRLRECLTEMERALPLRSANPTEVQLDLLGRPALIVPPEVRAVTVSLPRWLRPARSLYERRIASLLRAELLRPSQTAFSALASALRRWSRSVVARLSEQFTAQAEPFRAHARRVAGAGTNDRDVSRLETDLREIEGFDDS